MRRLGIRYITPRLIKARMSSTRHAVVRGPSLTGLGNRPALTPAHHVERPTGIGPFLAFAFFERPPGWQSFAQCKGGLGFGATGAPLSSPWRQGGDKPSIKQVDVELIIA
jgi:hypothetical protein